MALTAEQEAAFDRVIDDPAKVKEEIYAEWLKDNPAGTRQEFEDGWEVIRDVFGI